MELSYLDQLRLGDIEGWQQGARRWSTQPPGWTLTFSPARIEGMLLGAKDNIEFLLKIVREHERPH